MSFHNRYPSSPEFSPEEMLKLAQDAREMHRLYELGVISETTIEVDGATATARMSAMPSFVHDDKDSINVVAPAYSPFISINLQSRDEFGDLFLLHTVSLSLALGSLEDPNYLGGLEATRMDIPVDRDSQFLDRTEQETAGLGWMSA